MDIELLNVVVFAENYDELVKWYSDTFGLEVILEEKEGFHYTELGYNGKNIVGITPASEMKHTHTDPRNNSMVLQISTTDIFALFESVEKNKGIILFKPAIEKKYNFYYGGVADIEGNQIWIIDETTKI